MRADGLAQLLSDFRYSARTLRKTPVFTAIAVLSLALGIGANTAVFSILDGFVFRPLPVPRANRLVTPEQVFNDGFRQYNFSYSDYQGLAPLIDSRVLAGLAATS